MAKAADQAAEKLWDMIKDFRVCMLTTTDEDGTLRSRPMAGWQDAFDGTLWFMTRASSHKVDEIAGHHEVNLAYAEPDKEHYVSVSGWGEIVRDKDKIHQLWREYLTTWFPKGLDDPDIALLKVRVEKAEYWDQPSSAMVYLYGYAKAKLTGERPTVGENEKVNFRPQTR
ncbi:MAG TPA: pyridoxamine 5'-phosphate oxidase family protein [Azospirillaceae bacterium]|nr:pyridoxamine 5'-phosphate oxidase family protein [Azospirillaceae bacterium]